MLPRAFHANDDVMIRELVHDGFVSPFIAPALSRVLSVLSASWTEVPWYGLSIYALFAVMLAVWARSILDFCKVAASPDPIARKIVAAIAGVSVLAVGYLAFHPTFTIVAIGACAIGLVILAIELELAWLQERSVRATAMLGTGTLLAVGVAFRSQALVAAFIACAPLFVWLAVRMAGRRQRLAMSLAVWLLAPLAILTAANAVVSSRAGAANARFLRFNESRGQIHGDARFVDLHKRAPETIAAAGWTNKRFVEFYRWFYLDDRWYTHERVDALANTGGLRPPLSETLTYNSIRGVLNNFGMARSFAMLLLATGLALAALGRRRALVYALGAIAFTFAAGVAMMVAIRFPPRIALPLGVGASLALLVALATESRAVSRSRVQWRFLRSAVAAVVVLAGGLNLVHAASDIRSSMSARGAALIERAAKVHPSAVVISYAVAGLDRDPLAVRAASLPVVVLGWGTFSPSFYRALAIAGVESPRDLWKASIDSDRLLFTFADRYLDKVSKQVKRYGGELVPIDAEGNVGLYRARSVASASPSLK